MHSKLAAAAASALLVSGLGLNVQAAEKSVDLKDPVKVTVTEDGKDKELSITTPEEFARTFFAAEDKTDPDHPAYTLIVQADESNSAWILTGYDLLEGLNNEDFSKAVQDVLANMAKAEDEVDYNFVELIAQAQQIADELENQQLNAAQTPAENTDQTAEAGKEGTDKSAEEKTDTKEETKSEDETKLEEKAELETETAGEPAAAAETEDGEETAETEEKPETPAEAETKTEEKADTETDTVNEPAASAETETKAEEKAVESAPVQKAAASSSASAADTAASDFVKTYLTSAAGNVYAKATTANSLNIITSLSKWNALTAAQQQEVNAILTAKTGTTYQTLLKEAQQLRYGSVHTAAADFSAMYQLLAVASAGGFIALKRKK